MNRLVYRKLENRRKCPSQHVMTSSCRGLFDQQPKIFTLLRRKKSFHISEPERSNFSWKNNINHLSIIKKSWQIVFCQSAERLTT